MRYTTRTNYDIPHHLTSRILKETVTLSSTSAVSLDLLLDVFHSLTTSLNEAKYQYRKFLDKSALVASKLGPSKSASFIEKSNPAPSSERNQSPASTPTDQVLTATAAAASVVIPHRRPIVSPGHAALAKSNIPDCPLGLDKKTTPVPSTSSSSVWGDLSSLSTPGQDSSLPLQYKAPNSVPEFQLTTSTVSGPTTSTSYPIGVTSTGMGMNPFQSQMLTPSQQPMMSPFVPAGPIISTSFNNMPQQPFGQQWGTHPMMQSTTSFFQPQPQMSVQMQTTPNQQFISAPVTPTHHFLASSPSQQLRSHNSQPQLVQPLQTTTPTSAGFLLQTPISSQVNMGLGVSTSGRGTLGHPSFLDTTTMQMVQQQQMMQQQQQMMQQQQMLQQQQMFGVPQMQPMAASQMGPGGNVYGGGQVYSQGSQWGAI